MRYSLPVSGRILTYGFDIDFTVSSLIWCKLRLYLRQTFALISLTCICLATIDRYLITCQEFHVRRISQTLSTRLSIVIAIILVFSTASPIAISMVIITNKQNQTTCTYSSLPYLYYSTYAYNLLFLLSVPLSILTVFGFKTYKNLRKRRVVPVLQQQQQHRLDQQLTSMLLLQVVFIVISSIPYCIQSLYSAITTNYVKSSFRQAQETLFMTMTSLIFFLNYISNFYVYLVSSLTYRKHFVKIIRSLCFCFKPNEITPFQTTQSMNKNTYTRTIIN
ncbi:unnamed protein product [Didymodactylos carnosus]|uniref:G-protein coupled receptors family 1 profile domain-containing protein n=1 Tax=Didymodactylos carnosus TaxID=1234261 RepID=A0A8S2R1T5_9BILA|nr:unnamed protein product [Didymodactylos carnosus]CAF4133572.1 unnamed protein product [Didymodactylos carnosus]